MPSLFVEFEQNDNVTQQEIRRHRAWALPYRVAWRAPWVATLRSTAAAASDSTFIARMMLQAVVGSRPVLVRPAEAIARKRVLVVLEEGAERQILGETLHSIGASAVATSESEAEAAIERAQCDAPFDVMLVDANLGVDRASGLLAYARARTTHRLRAVVLIGMAGRTTLTPFREAGFNGYLIRPVRPVSLVTYLLGTDPVQPSHADERPTTMDDVRQGP